MRVATRIVDDQAMVELSAANRAEADLVQRLSAARSLIAGVEEYKKSIVIRIRRGQIKHPQMEGAHARS